MNRFTSGPVAAGTFAAITTLLGPYALREAAAAWKATHTSACRVVSGAVTYNTAGQMGNINQTTNAVLLCPLDGDTRVPSWNTSSAAVVVYGYANGASGITAKVCQTWAEGGGGNCTPTPTTSSGGVQQMSLPATILGGQESMQYAYVWIQLAPQNAQGSSNVVWGYLLSAP